MAETPPTPAVPTRQSNLLSDWRVQAAILFLAPVLIYAPSLHYGLIQLDDWIYYHNAALHGGAWAGLKELWTAPILSDYAPVSQLTFWLDLALFGSSSFTGARIHSLIWFGLGAVGVFALLCRVNNRRELNFAASLLYAVHPACSVAVLWLAERKNLVAFALAVWAVERYLAASAASASAGRKPLGTYFTAWLLFALALLAKPHALAVLPMLAAYELILARQPLRVRALRLLPFFIAAAAYFALSMHLRTDLRRPFLGGSRLAALVSDGPILLRYLAHTAAPVGLTLYYFAADLAPSALLGWACWGAAALIVAATVAVSRHRALATFGWMLAIAGLSPALNLVPQLAPMADHYLQWALPGLLLVMVLTIDDVLLRVPAAGKWARTVTIAAATLAFAFLAALRNSEFESKDAVYTTAVANQPDSALASAGYAARLIARHDHNAGYAAVHALACADQYRILTDERYLLTKEAASLYEAQGKAQRAEEILEAQAPYIDHRYLRMIRAETAVRSGHAEEALKLLDPPDTATLAAMKEVRAKCRSGEVLPDQFPPLVAAAEEPLQQLELEFSRTELLVSPLVIRAYAYLTLAQSKPETAAENLEKAFDPSALAVNLAPTRAGSRVLLGMIYERLHLHQAAQALKAKKPH